MKKRGVLTISTDSHTCRMAFSLRQGWFLMRMALCTAPPKRAGQVRGAEMAAGGQVLKSSHKPTIPHGNEAGARLEAWSEGEQVLWSYRPISEMQNPLQKV